MTIFRTLAATAAAVLLAAGAHAATIQPGNNPFPGSLEGSPSLAKCDTGATGVAQGQTRSCSNWEDGASLGDYSGAFTLDYTSEFVANWSFDPSLVAGIPAADVLYPTKIGVKAGDSLKIYTIVAGTLGGVIDSFGITVGNDNTPAISNVAFYDTGIEVIPLPAAGWLLLAGVGGLAAIRRRRTTA